MTVFAPDLPRCVHCHGVLYVLTDGPAPAVCRVCVRKLGTIAANPYAIGPSGRQALLDGCLDVVDIRDGRWAWSSRWPGIGDMRLAGGGRA